MIRGSVSLGMKVLQPHLECRPLEMFCKGEKNLIYVLENSLLSRKELADAVMVVCCTPTTHQISPAE